MNNKSFTNLLRAYAAVVVVCAVAFLILAGCSHTEAGIRREQTLYRMGTNTTSVVDRYVIPVVPAPWNAFATGANAIATALLALWNTNQGKRLKLLAVGKPSDNGVVSGVESK